MKYIQRTLEKSLSNFIDKTPVIMLTGPRQVGKLTILEYMSSQTKQKINYVTLDNLMERSIAEEDPELFLRNHETPLIIDEFQYAPKLLNYIKIKVDEARKNELFGTKEKTGTLYYLTGSRIFETMNDVSESLAGRVFILNLYGFSNRELEKLEESAFIPDISNLKKRIKTPTHSTTKIFDKILNGGYPEIINMVSDTKEQFYNSYIRTYIEKDIRKLINIKDENKFFKFICAVAARTGQEYNESDIARDVEVDNKTISEWISILKNTHLITLLPAYANNNMQKIIKRPKIYFMDTGLACYLTGYMTKETLEKSIYNGAIFETYVVTEIIKSFTNNALSIKNRLYYFRNSNGKEIDLLIFYDNKVYPIEIKKSANPSKDAIKNFDVLKNFKVEIGTGIVICMVKEIIAIDDNNYFVPIEYV